MFPTRANPARPGYYGYYSNVSLGKRKKADSDEPIPSIPEPIVDPDVSGNGSSKDYRGGAGLIQKIHETDPLHCPKCH
jgi:hypothetical protein